MLSLVSRACFVGACFAGPWSRDPARTVAERVELHVSYECFVIAHANVNVIVNTNGRRSRLKVRAFGILTGEL